MTDLSEVEPDSTISRAVWDGNLERVRELLDAGENVDYPAKIEWTYEGATGRTPLMYAILGKDIPMVRLLLSYGADVNARTNWGRTPAMYADVDILPLLFERGVDLNAGDERGNTALILAAWSGDVAKATRLLDHGAAVDLTPKAHLKTPLMYALIQNCLPMVELLIARGADVNAVTHNGRTPIMFANTEALPILHEQGADVNAVDTGWRVGMSVLMQAIEDKDIPKARWLLEHGADPYFQYADGETAMKYAIDNEMPDFVTLLSVYTIGAAS